MQANEIRVWDPLVRGFHWTLVLAFFIAYFTEDDLLALHVWAGYTVLGLVLVRLVWGLIGTRYARFSSFLYRPAEVKGFLRDTLHGRARRYLGHNPAGGAMIILMLVVLILTGLSGLVIYGIEEGAGPLAMLAGSAEWIEEVAEESHEFLANFMLLLVIVHVIGVLVESLLHHENLARSMITGRKRA
ncbi:MAG TPA: cytochrome B [Chromatiales bacterium]|nr:cytochrome B [Chromatiales bacterium]